MKNKLLYISFCLIIFGCIDTNIKIEKIINKEDYYIEYSKNNLEIYRFNDNTKMSGSFKIHYNNILKESFIVDNGLLIDYYKTYYPNGNIATESNYKEGNKIGKENMYYPSGKLKSTYSYKNNNRQKASISYYENGDIQSKTDDQGKSIYYSKNGSVFTESNSNENQKIYKNGKLHAEEYDYELQSGNISVFKIYNANGSIKKIMGFKAEEDKGVLYILDENHTILDSIIDQKKLLTFIEELGPEFMQ